MEKKNGFTILEMMIVMLIVALLLLITLPNIQQKEQVIRKKGCEALLEIVNSQIMLYEIDQLETPSSVQELIDFGYLKKGQDTCPDHSKVVIENGQAIYENEYISICFYETSSNTLYNGSRKGLCRKSKSFHRYK